MNKYKDIFTYFNISPKEEFSTYFTIKNNEDTYKVHNMMISYASNYFKALLSNDVIWGGGGWN